MEPHVFVVMPFGLKEARAATKAVKATRASKAIRAKPAINVNFDDIYDLLIEKLGKLLRGAIDVDEQTVGSPVYDKLVGLKPADWSNIKTARANYFGEVFADWKARIA